MNETELESADLDYSSRPSRSRLAQFGTQESPRRDYNRIIDLAQGRKLTVFLTTMNQIRLSSLAPQPYRLRFNAFLAESGICCSLVKRRSVMVKRRSVMLERLFSRQRRLRHPATAGGGRVADRDQPISVGHIHTYGKPSVVKIHQLEFLEQRKNHCRFLQIDTVFITPAKWETPSIAIGNAQNLALFFLSR